MENDCKYYFKTPETARLDEHFGDITGNIRGGSFNALLDNRLTLRSAKEAEISQIMSEKLAEYEQECKHLGEIIAHLDW